ncbi:MAG: CRTAC1 family protein [Planctomycetia bacterium]|nr:CRTAC1 family protein [Planctomycetia bacterium]
MRVTVPAAVGPTRRSGRTRTAVLLGIILLSVLGGGGWFALYVAGILPDATGPTGGNPPQAPTDKMASRQSAPEELPARPVINGSLQYVPHRTTDTSGFFQMAALVPPWRHDATLAEVGAAFEKRGFRIIEDIDRRLALRELPPAEQMQSHLVRVLMFNYEGQVDEAYAALGQLRNRVEKDDELARDWLYTIIHLQAVASMRRGENENCVMCRGESSCIIPIAPSAVHTIPAGSRQAIVHFTEYLEQFPDDLGVRWGLNLAHMTLGEHPQGVDPRFVVSLEHFRESEFNIGTFRDIGHVVGLNRFNQSGGGLMEDFDGDGLLDVAVTSIDANAVMGLYRNGGDGKFVEMTDPAGVAAQLGGLNCGQTDFNNDGLMDIFIPRGAWFILPVRPSLLRNDGDGRFTDVTREAGLGEPLNSNSCAWADYDNDGLLDLFIACERQVNRLYHNEGNGTFVEVARQAGVQQDPKAFCKAGIWLDYDNDDFPDLFLNNLEGTGRLFHNNRNGTFTDVSDAMGIDGPQEGFPCWAWDYDNDGWLDIFATSYFRSIGGVVKGMLGEPFEFSSNRLFHNVRGERFEDRTRPAGLDMVLGTMGCNFADLDNDGYLDMYLGTGAPGYDFLVPNRMFKNVAGARFADVTGTSRTGNLQKGHGVACGDWDRDGNVDVFIQLGGPAIGDRYHDVLFQNPGHANRWITLKLVGRQTNRPAIGARIKIVVAGPAPLTVHRHISSGSSFGANPLEQTIGLGPADRIAELEVHWPTSGTTQVFRDVDVNQSIEITEFATDIHKLKSEPIVWQTE